ncbi:TrkH family potassium uptake protein [Cuneatibacter sp. NSJ-177]|uniref:TrkH family potassium uptake protein n=1 Tax=Cuneatibacter sp. NSJ-177 TaxID=2931401 RepID=UPI001FD1F85E|nr:TrkH family potassium uptake protein [Cuneatibacter sp. NSJ-177]MCJ7835449.1 TrkH family potassium uptake protein [Cuneatibacter sp. NSJ-177]
MNGKMISHILYKLMGVEGVLLLIPMGVAILYGEESYLSFLIVAAALIVLSLVLGAKKPKNPVIYAKEGLFIVGLTWLVWSIFGALPFVISGTIPNFLDAFFETVSGFTTTGSTILTDIEVLPRGILFWRSFTHWIGGMGVLVFVLAIIPLADKRSMYLMRAEVPGPTVGKLVPRTMGTAKILYAIYIGLTALQVILLMFGGLSLYDALVHAFGTAGTGGFSVYNASIAAYNSAYVDGVITVFMILFGINFNLFYLMIARKFAQAFKSEELWTYLGIIASSVLVITINIYSLYGNVMTSIRYASFQVASIITTTGYATADFAQWPYLSQMILLLLMILGACAGSTGGGIKTARVVILVKSVRREMKRLVHPRSVSVVRMEGKVVEEETVQGVHTYLLFYTAILFVSVLLIALNGFDVTTTVSSVLACLNNVGPGLGEVVGPTGNFSTLSYFSKVVLSLDMLIGRLEIFPILLLVIPSLWKKK